MAGGHDALTLPRPLSGLLPAALAAGFVILVALAALSGLIGAAGGLRLSILGEPYVLAALRFTIWQAFLSAILSVTLGAALALALARRRFPGRDLLLSLLSASFVLPVIIAVLGIVAVHGRGGLANQMLRLIGLDGGSYLYGLTGILLAHVFFNAPFAARIYLIALSNVPDAHWRLARSLGFRPLDVFRIIDRPLLARETPAIFGLVFMLCAASFAAVLALGGGPASATLEVAIYEAMRFDFDLARAATLALAQIALALAALALPLLFRAPAPERRAGLSTIDRPDGAALSTRLLDALTFLAAFGLIGAPILGAAVEGLRAPVLDVARDESFRAALIGSLTIALPAGLLSTGLALAIASGAAMLAQRRGRPGLGALLTQSGALILAVPPFALATGLFVLARGHVEPTHFAMPLVALVNGLMALPFALRLIGPAIAESFSRHDRLARSLGLEGWTRLVLIDAPLLRRPVGAALAMTVAYSIGDFGVAALFGTGEAMTLPVLLYAYLGSYQIDRAAAVMLLLGATLLLLFFGIERLVGGRRD